MKIPIDIKVRSERICTDLSHRNTDAVPETNDFCVSGFMKKTKDGLRLEYVEDADRTLTTISAFNDNTVSLNRIGNINSHMVFADGKPHTCICDTGFFPLQMRICTQRLENSLSMQGGRLDIDYTVEIVGNLAEKNRLTVSVAPDKSIIKS